MKNNAAYSELLNSLKRLDRLESIASLLSWDETVFMPSASQPLRSEQLGHYSEILHREASHPRIGELLFLLEQDDLSAEAAINVREARKEYDRRTRIPAEFASRKAQAQSRGYALWVEARKADRYEDFRPALEEHLALAKEEAAYLDKPVPYDYWIDQFDPGMTRQIIEPIFDVLKSRLKSMVAQILASPSQPDNSIFKGFPLDRQETFLKEVVAALGFDFSRGRIDSTVHPFCGGHPLDTRMTTRFDENNPLDSLTSAIHETGHGLYQQGLPDAFAGTALGSPVGMAVHESQSRIYENQIARSRAFWSHWEPRYRALFPEQLKGISSDQLYRAINKVDVTPIRVDADEVTYNLHIILRFEIEKGLFDGSITPATLPEAWAALSEEILGFRPSNNRLGCLQDVHWSHGMFGYFPSYTLGNVLAAQLWYKIREVLPDLDDQMAANNYAPLLQWLRTHVHSKGRRFDTLSFTREVIGQELAPDALLHYLEERYLSLYTAS
jgi:carboxypeptidase Taq